MGMRLDPAGEQLDIVGRQIPVEARHVPLHLRVERAVPVRRLRRRVRDLRARPRGRAPAGEVGRVALARVVAVPLPQVARRAADGDDRFARLELAGSRAGPLPSASDCDARNTATAFTSASAIGLNGGSSGFRSAGGWSIDGIIPLNGVCPKRSGASGSSIIDATHPSRPPAVEHRRARLRRCRPGRRARGSPRSAWRRARGRGAPDPAPSISSGPAGGTPFIASLFATSARMSACRRAFWYFASAASSRSARRRSTTMPREPGEERREVLDPRARAPSSSPCRGTAARTRYPPRAPAPPPCRRSPSAPGST